MSTPRKGFANFDSPYAKPVKYPSTSADYLSLQIGGPSPGSDSKTQLQRQRGNFGQRYTSTPAKQNHDRDYFNGDGEREPNFHQNRQQRGGHNRNQNRFHGGGGGFRNNYQHNRWSSGGGFGGNQQKSKQTGNNEFDFSAYFHPSMLEDPWKQLIERRNALRRSEIHLQPSEQQSDSENEDNVENGANTSTDMDTVNLNV